MCPIPKLVFWHPICNVGSSRTTTYIRMNTNNFILRITKRPFTARECPSSIKQINFVDYYDWFKSMHHWLKIGSKSLVLLDRSNSWGKPWWSWSFYSSWTRERTRITSCKSQVDSTWGLSILCKLSCSWTSSCSNIIMPACQHSIRCARMHR